MKSLPAIILFLYRSLVITIFIFLVSGCVTDQGEQIINHSYEYEKLEISTNSIKETIEPGMSIFIETKDIYGWFTVIGYEGSEALVCIDEHDIKKQNVIILVKDIEVIRLRNTGTTTYDTGNFTGMTGLSFYDQTIRAGTAAFIFILFLLILAV
jgi:hypothetical protein